MRRIARIIIRFTIIFLLLLVIFMLFMLNPQMMYANKYNYRGISVYSSMPYDTSYNKVFDKAISLAQKSELYDYAFKLDVFLNDGSKFPKILRGIYGDAYAWGYHNNIILNGKPDESFQWIMLNGYNRQMARTVAHEMIHCYQYNALGLFHSRPLKNIPIWKWEGYPEYVCYKSSKTDEKEILRENIGRLINYENEGFQYAQTFVDEGPTFLGTTYLKFWLMVKYEMDIKGLSFKQLLNDKITESKTYNEMKMWYEQVSDSTLRH